VKGLEPLKYFSYNISKDKKKKLNLFMTINTEENKSINNTVEDLIYKTNDIDLNYTSSVNEKSQEFINKHSNLPKIDSIKKIVESINTTIDLNRKGRFKCYNMQTSKEINYKNLFLLESIENNHKLNGKIESMRINMKNDDDYRKIKKFSYFFPKISIK